MSSVIKNVKLPVLEKPEPKKLENDLLFLLENTKGSKGRKTVLSDFLNNTDTSVYSNTLQPLQSEYGEKKFIKP
tara:strand:+ start:2355 stop:2576 length:222 start_codon:yes stop_codon:yes gene_type:complete